MSDAVDQIRAAWSRIHPDVDCSYVEVTGRVTRIARIMDREFTEFFKGHGMEFWEFDLLSTLRRNGGKDGLTAGALNKALMVTSGAVTNRIDRMAAKGLVVRVADPSDRRAVRVQLTDAGRDLVDKLLPLHAANAERLLADFAGSDREAIVPLLRALAEALGDKSLS
ncbi:MarR family winged helix-turn-helix transcriptional regulator [Nocardia yamanashiensis]|uniref:MarR family winged helix-turn-helix transcriptional regulator n=1 Tax=Nocardia yamanashiensis TaxID=209247 RepID=UPI000834E806|nr:MarR family transcriptional regulator [Nocardia yamanashiensis]